MGHFDYPIICWAPQKISLYVKMVSLPFCMVYEFWKLFIF
jgi:hypothetical protein